MKTFYRFKLGKRGFRQRYNPMSRWKTVLQFLILRNRLPRDRRKDEA